MYVFGRGSVVDPSEYLHQYFHTGVTKRLEFSNPEGGRRAGRRAERPSTRVSGWRCCGRRCRC